MLNRLDRAARDGYVPARMAGPLGRALGHLRAARERGRARLLGFGLTVQGIMNSFIFLNLFNIYSLNMIQIQMQTSNDYSSQNKKQEHFITQENMQRHEIQQIIIYLYK
jgi:hypothetical protein